MVREGVIKKKEPGKGEEDIISEHHTARGRKQPQEAAQEARNKDFALRMKVLAENSISRKTSCSKQNSSKTVMWHGAPF